MKILRFSCAAVVLTLAQVGCEAPPAVTGDYAAFLNTPSQRVVGPDYRVSPPDRLSIQSDAWPDAGLDRVKVEADGTVTLPGLGVVSVAGFTADEIADTLKLRLQAQDPAADAPEVEVTVSQFASRHVYVFGHVAETGPFHWEAGTRLLDVLAEAQPVEGAATHRIEVVRPDTKGTLRHRVRVDANRVIRSGDDQLNLTLRAGDIVYVPEAGIRRMAWSPVPAPEVVEVEKIVEVPVETVIEVERVVEVPVETLVEVPVEKLVEVERIVEVEKIIEVPVTELVEIPVERVIEVERIVEVPVEKLVEVERVVEVPVERIVEVEKLVEVPVERVIEVERIVEVPVERIVEVEKLVHVAREPDPVQVTVELVLPESPGVAATPSLAASAPAHVDVVFEGPARAAEEFVSSAEPAVKPSAQAQPAASESVTAEGAEARAGYFGIATVEPGQAEVGVVFWE